MKRLLKTLKVTGIALLSIILLLTIATIAFVNLSPQFGGSALEDQQKAFLASGHYKDGIFVNEVPTPLDLGFSKTVSVMMDVFFGDDGSREPGAPPPVQKIDSAVVANRAPAVARLTWFG